LEATERKSAPYFKNEMPSKKLSESSFNSWETIERKSAPYFKHKMSFEKLSESPLNFLKASKKYF
jgi:hypothetical protein